MIDQYKEQGRMPEATAAPLDRHALDEFASRAEPGAYLAIHAYLTPSQELDALLRDLQGLLLGRYQLPVTVEYGPRFLHSTGQLHKGDAGRGLFVQLTQDNEQDIAIPDEAGQPQSRLTFGTLIAAQALGDRQALLDAGRQVIRFHLGGDPQASLRALAKQLR
jgi:glucose-6-phosphate isomerase/transaldolase/glucose-6-phosphate isomerase